VSVPGSGIPRLTYWVRAGRKTIVMSNPFEYLNAINSTKKDLMTGSENDELAEKNYVPYITNKTLSYFPDTIMYASAMNLHHDLDNKLQFHYLINSIRPRKRFTKWVKKQEDNDLDAIAEYYGYNRQKSEQALTLLSPEQLEQIKNKLQKGGST
jgi:hypothetical protein